MDDTSNRPSLGTAVIYKGYLKDQGYLAGVDALPRSIGSRRLLASSARW